MSVLQVLEGVGEGLMKTNGRRGMENQPS
jgi:hypothetical protein